MLDERRLRRVLEIGPAVVSDLDLEAVLQRVLETARELTGARYAALGILDRAGTGLERFITVGIDPETHRAIGDLPKGRGVLGLLIADPQPLRLDDVGDHPRSYGFPVGHPPMHGFLGVPIRVRDAVYGNLYLTDKDGGEPFDDADEEAIVLLAGWAGIAIDHARAYTDEQARRNELEQAVRGLEATTAIARAVGGETDLNRVLELIVKRGRALVEARHLLILLRDGDEMVVAAAAGRLGSSLNGMRIPLAGSISGHVLETRRPERLANVRDRLRHALADHIDAQAGLFVPLVFRGEALGVLAAYDQDSGDEFNRESERLLLGFAASAATAVATAQNVAAEGLRRSIEASERERQRWARELHDETLQELAGLKVLLSGARRRDDDAALRSAVDGAIEQLDTSIGDLRRLINDLRPAALDELGAQAALEGLAERLAATTELDVRLHVDLAFESGREDERHPAAIEDTIYRLVQEALTNVVKHAQAGRVDVGVVEAGQELTITVHDDGRGFDPSRRGDGFGLVGMRERVALVGGTIGVESGQGDGTTIRATIPVRQPSSDAAFSA